MKKLLLVFALLITVVLSAQYEIKPAEGFSPRIGLMVTMLEDLKTRITEQVKDLNTLETDFLFDEKANSIGSLVMHLAANEAYYQVESLDERQWSQEETEFWMIGADLGDESRKKLKEKPIQYYLDLWNEVRQKTLAGLRSKDDAWFASTIEEGLNYHWVWYHVMEHQANHMGQIAAVKNRLPKKE